MQLFLRKSHFFILSVFRTLFEELCFLLKGLGIFVTLLFLDNSTFFSVSRDSYLSCLGTPNFLYLGTPNFLSLRTPNFLYLRKPNFLYLRTPNFLYPETPNFHI